MKAHARSLAMATMKESLAKRELAKRGLEACLELRLEPAIAAQAAAAAEVPAISGRTLAVEPVPGVQVPHTQQPGIIVAPPDKLGTAVMPQAVDVRGTTPSGSVTIDAATPEQVQRNLAAAAGFFWEQGSV